MSFSTEALAQIQTHLAEDLAPPPATPNAFVAVLEKHIRQLNTSVSMSPSQAELVEGGVLRNSFPAFLMRHDPARASNWVVHIWQDYASATAQFTAKPDEATALEYDLAVRDFLSGTYAQEDGRQHLRRILISLGLSQDEAGRMFKVSGETIRRWERGQVRIPLARQAELVSAEAALARLETLFLPERLAQVIRRPAGLFQQERALDLILRGLIADVAQRYEIALTYQA